VKALRLWLKQERGASTAALFIIAMPIIVGMFGIAFDTTRLLYARNLIQNQVDLAVQSAINMTYNDPADLKVHFMDSAPLTLQTLYTSNMASKRGDGTSASLIGPIGASGVSQSTPYITGVAAVEVIGAPLTNAQLCDGYKGSKYGIKATVSEQVPATFMKILGVQQFTLTNISSTAYVRAAGC
jgi:Putative Flp pilus-assembly TadE/G-like